MKTKKLMNRKNSVIFISLTVSWICLGSAEWLKAAETDVSARSSGLGGALTALADDADALYYNPAGLVHLVQYETSASYGFMNNELRNGGKAEDWAVNCAIPLPPRIGAMGLSWRDFSEHGSHREQMAALGYGKTIIGRWAAGFAGRYFNRRLDDAQMPALGNGDVASSFGVDIGVLGRMGEHWSVGLMANGLNNPERAVHYQNSDAIRYGLGYKGASFSITSQFNVVRSSEGSGKDLNACLGAEKWWLGGDFLKSDFGLRGGFTMGPDNSKKLSSGVSYRTRFLQLDYGFVFPVYKDQFRLGQASHRLTLTCRFGQTAPNKKSVAGRQTLNRLVEKTKQEIEFYQYQTEMGLSQAQSLESSLVLPAKALAIDVAGQRNEKRIAKKMLREQMTQYWSKKDQGATLPERVITLTALVSAFKPYGISTRRAEKELAATLKKMSAMEKKWAEERSRYVKSASEGADPMVRAQTLFKSVKKYAPYGLSMDLVKEELDSMGNLQ